VPIAKLAIATCALLALAACGVQPTSEAAEPGSAQSPTAAAEHSSYPTGGPTTESTPGAGADDTMPDDPDDPMPDDDAVRAPLGKGVELTATAPTTFTPTDTAYPKASRAIALDLELDNGGTIAFRPTQLAFEATVDGKPAAQVIDSTQGYNGISSAADELAPDQTLRFSVAFAVPEKSCSVRVWVRPDSAAPEQIELYTGVV
jgi:hypothetical protein